MKETIKEKFKTTEKLYHYTTFETACKIIASNKLKYGFLKGMNDINEAYRPGFWEEQLKLDHDPINDAISKFKQLSFSIDDKHIMGFDIPIMWGYYADKGNGVCLVYDKSIIDELTKDSKLYYRRKIKYDLKYPDINVGSKNIDDYLWRKKNTFFFKKTQDWKHEQEYRVITRAREDFLVLPENALVAVILCYAKSQNDKSKPIGDSIEVKILESLIDGKDIPLVYYSYHNFINNGQSALTQVHGDYTLWPIMEFKYDF